MNEDQLIFRVHALRRMVERQIGKGDIRHVLNTGETVENYAEDWPYPSRLILGWCHERPLHVVAAFNKENNTTIIVTAYEPDPLQWEANFKTRKLV